MDPCIIGLRYKHQLLHDMVTVLWSINVNIIFVYSSVSTLSFSKIILAFGCNILFENRVKKGVKVDQCYIGLMSKYIFVVY